MTDETQEQEAPLPQPPREVEEVPAPAPEAQEGPAESPQRARITLTVARDLGSRSRSLQARYIALARALSEVGVNGEEVPGLRGHLNEAFRELHEAAPHMDVALKLINDVTSSLEEL